MFEWLEELTIHADEPKASAQARVPADHPFLADHFPGVPILPGSLQIELCAQVAGPLVEDLVARRHGIERWAFVGKIRNATFHAATSLPATLWIFATATRVGRDAAVVQAVLTHAFDVVDCEVELLMLLRPAEPGWEHAIGTYRARIAALKGRAQR
jgi:3-hydroxymyristoyl/3-hydroxydecanoyl-(acyl carrier protein) dehydratase